MGMAEELLEMRRRMNKPSEKPIWQDEVGKKYLSESGEEKNKSSSKLVQSLSSQVAESRLNNPDEATRESAVTYVKEQTPQELEAKKRALQALANQVPKKKSVAETIKNTNLMGNINKAMKKKE